jgi:hypothetical protein
MQSHEFKPQSHHKKKKKEKKRERRNVIVGRWIVDLWGNLRTRRTLVTQGLAAIEGGRVLRYLDQHSSLPA